MKGAKDKNKKLSKSEADLWKAATRDVRRLPGRHYAEEAEREEERQEKQAIREYVPVKPKAQAKAAKKGKDVDRRTAERLRKGKMEIEATLDLHGMTQAEARDALTRFIQSSHKKGRRCVLVITGKGLLGRPGVLKTKVPEWLAAEPLEPLVLMTAAARKHGGEGAIYVLLRRERE